VGGGHLPEERMRKDHPQQQGLQQVRENHHLERLGRKMAIIKAPLASPSLISSARALKEGSR